MRHVTHLLIVLLSIVFAASYVNAGGGHGVSRSGAPSYGGGSGGGKYSGYSNPSNAYKGSGGKQSGAPALSGGLKGHGGTTYAAKDSKSFKDEVFISPYGQGTPREECMRFYDEISGPRREFANKRSAYFDARANPQSNPADIESQKKEIRELFRVIEEKNTQNCRWVY